MPKCILSYERSCFAVERHGNVLLCSRAEHVNTLRFAASKRRQNRGESFSAGKTEGFGKNQRHCFGKFAENNPCGLCRHPYPRMEARTPPIASQTEGDITVFQVFS